jgi:hypothetical protein
MSGKNRIVVDYGEYEGLVLLGAFNNNDGHEIPYSELESLNGFDIVQKYDGIEDYSILKSMVDNNAEGFVVRFSNGDRMKIKGEEYLRLHKIMTNITTTGVWEVLKSGGNMDELLKEVPDEFYKKIKSYVRDLRYAHYQYYEYAGKIHDYFRYGKYNDVEVEPSKKEFALHLERNKIHPKIKAVCFAIWDKKDYDKIIWELIRPEFKKL